MKSIPLVSIITPVYNGAEYLDDLIVSVRDQDYPNIEHIIIDDGSTDNGATLAVLKKYPLLRWWSRENRGQYATMNEGLEAAKGDYICFISADDFMAKNAVRLAMEWLNLHSGFDGVYGLTTYITKNGEPYPIRYPFRRAPLRYYPYFAQLQHCSFYISKQIIKKYNLMLDSRIRFVGDYDWILRILNAKIRIGFIDQPLSTIRVHENQMSSQNRDLMTKEQIEIANRNGFGGFQFNFFLSILHALNFTEQMRFAFKKNQLAGIKDTLQHWVFDKLIPQIRQK